MPSFEQSASWGNKFLPEITAILGTHLVTRLIRIAPAEEDMERNTDLMILGINNLRVACRMRTHGYLRRYPDQFTIRTARPSGQKTELRKIVEGWGSYNFYGFATEDDTAVAAWVIGDLNVFRSWHSDEMLRTGKIPGIEQPNGDNSSLFRAYNLNALPQKFVVARKIWAEDSTDEALLDWARSPGMGGG